MRVSSIAGAAAVLILGCGIGVAEDDFDPEAIIEARQAALRDVGGAFKAISDELRKSTPSMPTIASNAQQIEELISHRTSWFPQGTGPESDVETQAKPEIWSSGAEFARLQAAFGEHAQKLRQAAASGGTVVAVQAQWRELGKTCKGCHDKFREEDE